MTIELKLKGGHVAVYSRCDHELVSQYKWCAGWTGRGYYAMSREIVNGKRKTVYMHRLILPDAEVVDHGNNNGLDNRRGNLRACTKAQNQWNAGKRGGKWSRYKGVFRLFRDGKFVGGWYAQIKANRKSYYLGSFTTEVKAAKAYDAAAIELHGEFAKLNFPIEGGLDDVGTGHRSGLVAERAGGAQSAVPSGSA
jgi:hypothetical protein